MNSWVLVTRRARVTDRQLEPFSDAPALRVSCSHQLALKGFRFACANQLRVLKHRFPFFLGGPREHSAEAKASSQLRATRVEESTRCSRNMRSSNCQPR